MIENLDYSSALKEDIVLHLLQCKDTLTIASYHRRISQLHDWDDFLVDKSFKEEDSINEELVNEWVLKLKHSGLADRTIMTYVNALRKFLLFYSQKSAEVVYIPPSHKYDDDYIPYLFTDDEMEDIYKLADNYKKGYKNQARYIEIELPILIRLFDCCGFRLNELITLSMEDVDLKAGVIRIIMNAKNGRQRLVPLESEMTEQLKSYSAKMGLVEGTAQCLFPYRSPKEPLSRGNVENAFNSILVTMGIRKKGGNNHKRGPCIHCLRHRFVFRSIKQLMAHGITLEDSIPYLSIYLGHDSLYETEKYMKFSAEMFPEEWEKFAIESEQLYPDEDYWDDWV